MLPEVEIEDIDEQKQKQLEEFRKIQRRAKLLKASWGEEIKEVEVRRQLREISIDIWKERRLGNLTNSETVIPQRIIDDNIRKEAPAFINFIVKPRYPATFVPKIKTDLQSTPLESWFSRLVKYDKWEIDFISLVDGTQAHGGQAIEIKFDISKPGHFANESVCRENLWYSTMVKDIQKATLVIKRIEVAYTELKAIPEVKKEELDKLVGNKLSQSQEGSSTEADKDDIVLEIHVCYYRDELGVVNVCMFNIDHSTDFLRAPRPLYLGIDKETVGQETVVDPMTGVPTIQETRTWEPIYEKLYPFEVFSYTINEQQRLKEIKGRVFLDEYIQTGITSMASILMNAWHRASKYSVWPKNPTDSGASKILETPLPAQAVWTQPMEYSHPPYPDSQGALAIIQAYRIQNKSESGQVDFSVTEKRSSRTTATEVDASKEQASILSAIQTINLSIFLRQVFTRNWAIARSQALQGLLNEEVPDPAYLQIPYTVRAAGDSEIVERAELRQNMKDTYPVVAQTPAGIIMLEDILSNMFPAQADKYIAALRQGQAGQHQLAQSLGAILQQIVAEHPEIIPPEDMQTLQELIAQSSAGQPAQQNPQPSEAPQPNGQQ